MFDRWQKQAEHESEGTGINGVLKHDFCSESCSERRCRVT